MSWSSPPPPTEDEKVFILQEENDDADDELEYLASWSSPPIYDEDSEEEFTNPFAEKVFTLEETLDYPTFRPLQEILASASATSVYNPASMDTSTNLPGYAPATGANPPIRPSWEGGAMKGTPKFKRLYNDEMWNLPSAKLEQAAMFVVPTQVGMFHEVFSRWESITRNLCSERKFSDNQEKADFIENLLGEDEKVFWVSWRMMYTQEYTNVVNSGEGREGTNNILSQIRKVFSLEDPTQGTTGIQDQALQDLEQLQCKSMKDVVGFMNDYWRLAAKSGQAWMGPELSEKFWLKLPGFLGAKIKKEFDARHPNVKVGLLARVLFAYKYLEEDCKQAAYQKSLRDFSFCSQIPIPGYYKGSSSKKKYGFLSVNDGEEMSDGIFSVSENEDNEMINSLRQMHLFVPPRIEVPMLGINKPGWRPAIMLEYHQMICHHEWQFHQEVPQTKCVCCKIHAMQRWRLSCPRCSVVTCGLCAEHYYDIKVPLMTYISTAEQLLRNREQEQEKLVRAQQEYINWCDDERKHLLRKIELHEAHNRATQFEGLLEEEFNQLLQEGSHAVAGPPRPVIKEPTPQVTFEASCSDPKGKQCQIDSDTNEEPAQTTEVIFVHHQSAADRGGEDDDTFNFDDSPFHVYRCMDESVGATTGRVVRNRLYNLELLIQIEGLPHFNIKAILDTGATTCCVDENSVPANSLEDSAYVASFTGVNSEQRSSKKLKAGKMSIGENIFFIPYTYALPMRLGGEIQMILGCNFIRSMKGGMKIEGETITFYKNITTVQTSQEARITSLVEDENEYLAVQEEVYYVVEPPTAQFQNKFKGMIQKLTNTGYIGEKPLAHWGKNKITCSIELKNPDFIIEDRPLKQVTPQMKQAFQKHIDALLKIGVIRPSKSKHRTIAIIVYSGTTQDPITGVVTKGKERMVFNYRRLNDNTEKDQYSLPGINSIIKRVAGSNIYSKFDLKSGFHQVMMSPESIPLTAFWVPQGL
ncbi:Polyprotein P3 [Nymphaea thermarum]|nr:Polyprotein P3 [Nymphaea thermarum]